MLVLSRKVGEAIQIGDNVTLRIVEVHGDKVRLGIDAPKHVKVNREEVDIAIKKKAKAEAAMNADGHSKSSQEVAASPDSQQTC